MKTIEELTEEMVSAQNKNYSDWEDEVISKVILASECSQSKRDLLGLKRKHREARELPLFAEKKLF
jgi:hypothetical protein